MSSTHLTILTPKTIGLGSGDPNLSVVGTGKSIPWGVDAVFQYNNFIFNDRNTVDKIRVISIEGLDDADIRDTREDNPAEDGETAYDSLYGGRTLVFNGKIEAFQRDKLRDLQQAFRTAFSNLTEEPLYFITNNRQIDHFINCKKFSKIQWTEEQKDSGTYYRDFQLTVRASNPEFFLNRKKTVSLALQRVQDRILSHSPQLYWPLTAEDGATDQSGNARDGTPYGSITIGDSMNNLTGQFGDTSTDFGGVSQSIISSYNPFTSNSQITIVGFLSSDTDNTTDTVFGGTNASTAPYLRFNSSGSGGLVFFTPQDGQPGSITGYSRPGVGEKVMVAMKFDESASVNNFEYSVNGVSQTSSEWDDISTNYNTPGNFEVGAWGGLTPVTAFDGQMSHVAIFNTLLSSSDLLDISAISKQVSITNAGNYPADPIIRIVGGLSDIEFNLETTEGIFTFKLKDTVIIDDGDFYKVDIAERTIVDSNGNNKFNDLHQDSDLPKILPGESFLVIPDGKCMPTSSSAAINIEFRDTFI